MQAQLMNSTPTFTGQLTTPMSPATLTPAAAITFIPGMQLRDVEKSVIISTLKALQGNRTHAARALGIGIRTLQRKLKRYEELDPDALL